jgi:hypothetical protein
VNSPLKTCRERGLVSRFMTNGMISISPIVNFPYLFSDFPASLAYGVYISQLILYARACVTYDQFLIQGSLLTNKLMSQGFQQSCLQADFCKFSGRYNNLIYPYNLSLGHMLSDMFHTNR